MRYSCPVHANEYILIGMGPDFLVRNCFVLVAMFKCFPLVSLLVTLSALPAVAAEVRELSQNEIRDIVATGQSKDLGALMAIVGQNIAGELVDVRSFEAGDIFFQMTVLLSDGSLVTVIINGRTGALLPSNSEEAKVVRAAAKANGRNGGGSANSNAGGNGNGNSGGNGNGNSGGGGNGKNN